MKNKRSREWFQAPEYYGFGRRAWLRSEGFPADVFDGKPVIGICNSWSELNNCNAHLRDVAMAVKRGDGRGGIHTRQSVGCRGAVMWL
jgi:L-arabonate dehydrase